MKYKKQISFMLIAFIAMVGMLVSNIIPADYVIWVLPITSALTVIIAVALQQWARNDEDIPLVPELDDAMDVAQRLQVIKERVDRAAALYTEYTDGDIVPNLCGCDLVCGCETETSGVNSVGVDITNNDSVVPERDVKRNADTIPDKKRSDVVEFE